MNFFNKTRQLKVLVGLLLFSTGISAQNFKLVDIKSADLENLSGSYEIGDSKVEIAFDNITFDPDYYSACFSEVKGMLHFTNYGASNYSYITIDNVGSDDITAVEITGMSSGGGRTSSVHVAFSGKPSSATSDFEYSANQDYVNPALYFKDGEFGCQELSATLPVFSTTANGMFLGGGEVTFVKSVKIALSTNFGMHGISSQYPFFLQGIAVYTDRNPTGLNNAMQEKVFTSYVSGNELKLTEPAQVSVYTISGTLVETVSNVDSIPLNNLPSGMYVVKALSETGKTLVAKIVR